MKDDYTNFEIIMDSGKIYLDPSVDFRTICRKIGASPLHLNSILKKELGVSGKEILSKYRRGV